MLQGVLEHLMDAKPQVPSIPCERAYSKQSKVPILLETMKDWPRSTWR